MQKFIADIQLQFAIEYPQFLDYIADAVAPVG